MTTTLNTEALHELLGRDALHEAEQITGESYKDDERTMRIGLLRHLALNEAKKAALQVAGDSYFSMSLAELLSLYSRAGFEEVLCDVFMGHDGPETFRILWNPEGILATVESYYGDRVNTTKIFYNVEETTEDHREAWARHSSGHYHRKSYDAGTRIWVGDHDAREGVINAIIRFKQIGNFLPQWVENDVFSLLTYTEWSDQPKTSWDESSAYRKAITDERWSRLPENVREAIGPVSR